MSGSESSARAGLPAESDTHRPLPASPLDLTVHRIDPPSIELLARQRRGRAMMLAVLAICVAPVLASYLTFYVFRPQASSNYGQIVHPARAMPPLGLSELDGKGVDAASLRGQWLLVAVGASGCDAACEQRLWLQRQLREMLGRDRDRLDKLWLVTDEGRPRPELARALAAVPVPPRVLRVDAAALAGWLQPGPSSRLEEHLYLVDPMGNWMMRMPVQPDPQRVKRDLDRLMRASASWDRAGR
jgi:hypothetical protein